jgi:hypothetical protein
MGEGGAVQFAPRGGVLQQGQVFLHDGQGAVLEHQEAVALCTVPTLLLPG